MTGMKLVYFYHASVRSNIRIFRGRRVSPASLESKSQMPPAQVDSVDTVMGTLKQKQPLQTLPGVVEEEESEF